jgi:Hydrophobic surface binding protein A
MLRLMRQIAVLAVTFSLTTASPFRHLEPRQSDLSSQEIADINKVGTDLTSLNGTLNAFTTNDPIGVIEALKVQLQTSTVSNDLVAATKTAQQSSNFTANDSGNIASAVLSLLPVITGTLNNIVEHKPAFATAILFVGDISQTVEQNLMQQRQLSAQFATALAAKLSEPYSSASGLVAGQIDSGELTSRLTRP